MGKVSKPTSRARPGMCIGLGLPVAVRPKPKPKPAP